MQIILIKDIDNLGSANEVVDVKPGYARNFFNPSKNCYRSFCIQPKSFNRKK
ncbi:MAG: 50S ribosomal protein L9P [Bacteroidetes bacterium OLB11]|nr:MAG: 50S ribosomal protein L9P [Bacteroidetes bacterium OLB11]